ncbi:RNA polymerase sigma factor [Paractinoplanes rishiriensis]|uniref:RNA polymerase sigma factor n=1 Tax=Paractinoplanes rishiriensis TaxID=1050105 RepID=A0A919K2M9_9ACTN|nr:sigma-70 family RNA polymerase sigma factor [Actinoplanes rishiriensis]GIE99570.1 hypothetical protein Ari01nite_70350 [Actinoplanes rishiriensis]
MTEKTGTATARLVTAAQAGDETALATLMAAHLPVVTRIVGRALQGHADVDDVVQETMVRVMRALPRLREPDRFEPWLNAVVHRQIQLYLRGRRRLLDRREEIGTEPPDPGGDFAERTVTELLLADQRRELTEAAAWLDDDDRRLLSLCWRETLGELTRAGLAAALAVNPKHAGVRVRRMKVGLEAVRGMVRALNAAPRCPDLARAVHGWDGKPGPVWRKRLTRHVRDCGRCSQHQRGLVSPEKLLLGVVSLPVAAEVTASSVSHVLTLKLAAGAAAVIIAAGGGFVYAVTESPAPPGSTRAVAVRPQVPTPPVPSAGTEIKKAVADIVVAPDGSGDGTGTLQRPYATLAKAVAVVRPGQTIVLRGGTYRPATSVTIGRSGTPDRRIMLTGYRDERPVIDAAGIVGDE